MIELPVIADLVWLPLALAVVVGILFAGSIAAVWLAGNGKTRQKVFRTISIVLWAVVFCGFEAALAWFASMDAVTGPGSLFVICCFCVAAGGALCVCSKAKVKLFRAQKRNRPQAASRVLCTILLWAASLLCIAGITLLCYVFIEMPSNSSWLSIEEPYLGCELSVIAGVVAGFWFIFQRRPIGFIIPLAVSFVYGIAEYFVEHFKAASITPGDLRSMSTGLNVAGGYEYGITVTILMCLALFALVLGALTWMRDPLARFLSRHDRVHGEGQRDGQASSAGEEDSHDLVQSAGEEGPAGQELSAEQERSIWERKLERTTHVVKNIAVAVLSIALGIFIMQAPIRAALQTDWEEEGIEFDYWQMQNSVDSYGLVTSFIYALQLEDLDEPPGYTKEQAEELQTEMALLYDRTLGATPERIQACEQFDRTKPNVVLVMNETFSDLSALGGLGVGYEGPTFIKGMNAIAKGKTDVSVYGGGTCNSEFEGLTGTSLGLVEGGITPYAIYDLSALDTLPKQFKAMGYDTTAIHPEAATNWGRDSVYPAIGFDAFWDQTYFVDAERSREHVTDEATYQKVMDVLRDHDSPQFVFDLTMMGHGGYETGLIPVEKSTNFDFTGIVDENAGAATNEYLSSIRMSDEEVQAFIDELEDFDEPVVLVFFGDHQPGFSWWFKDRFADDESDIAFQESMYETDYFIWANYDVGGTAGQSQQETAYAGSMPPASLMAWTLSYIGAPLTDYQKANLVSRYWVQSNNVYGYMDAAGAWHSMDDAKAIAGEDIFAQGMSEIAQAVQNGALPSETELLQEEPALADVPPVAEEGAVEGASPGTRTHQDAVMVNVLRWLAYLNFSSLIQ